MSLDCKGPIRGPIVYGALTMHTPTHTSGCTHTGQLLTAVKWERTAENRHWATKYLIVLGGATKAKPSQLQAVQVGTHHLNHSI